MDSPLARPSEIVQRDPGCLDQNPAAVYLGRLSPRSRPVQLSALTVMAGIITQGRQDALSLPWERLEYQHTAVVRTELARRYAPATANRMLSALRGVLKEAWRLGLMDVEQCQRACDVEAVRGYRLPHGRALYSAELQALFDSCDAGTPADLRDAAILAALYSGGLRRSECVALDLSDWIEADGCLTVRSGKGNKDRLCYLADFASDRILRYLEARGREPGPLFIRAYRGGRLDHIRMSDQAIRHIVRTRCAKAGVNVASPHDMRRSFISNLLDAGVDISTVQQMAGHASVATTQRYDRRGDAAKRRAAQRLSL